MEELCRCLIVLFLVLVTKALGPKQFQLPFRPQDDLLARAMAQGPKTVDVPASLPTPPHNNQEELRWVFPDIFKTLFGAHSVIFSRDEAVEVGGDGETATVQRR